MIKFLLSSWLLSYFQGSKIKSEVAKVRNLDVKIDNLFFNSKYDECASSALNTKI